MMDVSRQLSGRRVFLTGANGFIGRYLLGQLVRAGAEVTAWSRSRRTAASLRDQNVRAIVGDLSDSEALNRALSGQEIVFHLAYDGRATASSNIRAFDALYSAAQKADVRRLVHTSSIVVYDDWPGADIDEDSHMDRPGGGSYRVAKIEMERRIMNGSLPAAILQPTIVYGVGSALWTDQFVEQLLVGEIVVPTPEGLCNGVYVEDVVQALMLAAVVPQLRQERFVISGPEPFKWSKLLKGYADILGTGGIDFEPCEELQRRLGPSHDDSGDADSISPVIRAYAIGNRLIGRDRFERFIRSVKRQVARRGKLYPDHHLLGVYSSSGTCSISRARDRLGYEPAYDLAKGLAAMEPNLGSLVSGRKA